ncbi:MAG: DsrE family protein [Bacteroidota bacterium]|nr:DsrE family protein [Bacteroidota bacterium]
MKRFIFSSLLFFAFLPFVSAQTSQTSNDAALKMVADSVAKARKDSMKWEKLKSLAYFPLIKAGPWSGVLPVTGVDEIPDPKREYKLIFEFTLNFKDSIHKELNPGLVEIARVLNLHVASGIPLSHIHPVIVTHGPSLFSIENNATFQEKYKKDNPDSQLIMDLMKNGCKFIACGQAMMFHDIKKEELFPGVKVAVTAQVVLSNYIGQGYVLYPINDDLK